MKNPAQATMRAFWREVTTSEGDPCWYWRGAVGTDGAPIFSFAGTTVRAASFIYEAMVGKVGRGQRPVLTCGDTACVNTEHMELRREGEQRESAEVRA